ncbi:MAG: hypothetical protein P8010_04565, partial [Desulfosarcinaceae bacterium]
MYAKGLVNLFQHELRQLLAGDFQGQFPQELVRQADYSVDGVRTMIREVARRGDVDLVVALGFLASRETCLLAP